MKKLLRSMGMAAIVATGTFVVTEALSLILG
jgi:hypothetical protein